MIFPRKLFGGAAFKVEMSGFGVIGGITEWKQGHWLEVLGYLQLLDQFCSIEVGDPAGAKPQFRRLKLHVGGNDGSIGDANSIPFGIHPAGILVIADNKRDGSSELAGRTFANLLQNLWGVHHQDSLRLVVASSRCEGGSLQNRLYLLLLNGTRTVFAD